ncbi:hypothetical protein GUI04_23790 [Xanthomonas citri pv. citri]|nr:hypothetical protein [Xanthomonas citri pv. citri]MBD4785312.1 hypothetical protein [Xanthomonas citri pv. citri]
MRSAAPAFTTLFAVVLVLAVVLAGTQKATAASCSVSQLAPCAPAFTSGKPSAQCCANLKQQRPCLCGYIRNPSLRSYVTSPNARKVASTCGVPIPKC